MSHQASKPLVLDIETAPCPVGVKHALRREPVFEAPRNYKDPDKIAAKVAEMRESWVEKTTTEAGLSPLTGQVVCVVLADAATGDPWSISLEGSTTEAELLAEVRLKVQYTTPLITFNGFSFDAPFLRLRMLRHGIEPPGCLLPTPRYRNLPHMDLRMFLTNWNDRAKGRLEDWAAFLGIPQPEPVLHPITGEPISGADVGQLFTHGEHRLIRQYCTTDTQLTAAMFRRLNDLNAIRWSDKR